MQATNLFGRVDGDWRLLHHHASPSPTEQGASEETVN
jgi:hypothetical protein